MTVVHIRRVRNDNSAVLAHHALLPHCDGAHRAGVRTEAAAYASVGQGEDRSGVGVSRVRRSKAEAADRTCLDTGDAGYAQRIVDFRLRPVFAFQPGTCRPCTVDDGIGRTYSSAYSTVDARDGIDRMPPAQGPPYGGDGADVCTQTAPNALLVDAVCHVHSSSDLDGMTTCSWMSVDSSTPSSIPNSCNV